MSDHLIDPNAPAAPPRDVPALDMGIDMAPGMGTAAPTPAPGADIIKDSDADHFMADVIDASQTVAVIVDFWSPRSATCQKFVPLLEKLVTRAGGLVHLVKVNVDDPANQPLAKQLQVQSVPMVFAFQGGRPVDAFTGMQSESQLQTFIEKLIGDAKPPIEAAMEQAGMLLAAGDVVQAEAIYAAVLAQDDSYMPALAGMIRAIAAAGEFDRATEIIDALDAKTRNHVDISQAVSALELAQQSANTDTGEISALQDQVAAKPKDLDARFALAQALFAAGSAEDAIDHLLEIVKLDAQWNEAAGRKQLIKIFDALGTADPLTQESRRRLSAVLFS